MHTSFHAKQARKSTVQYIYGPVVQKRWETDQNPVPVRSRKTARCGQCSSRRVVERCYKRVAMPPGVLDFRARADNDNVISSKRKIISFTVESGMVEKETNGQTMAGNMERGTGSVTMELHLLIGGHIAFQ